MRANFTPSAEPPARGLDDQREAERALDVAAIAAAAPSSLIDASRTKWKSGVGMPASRIRCLASTLSVQRMHAAGPEPV